MEIDSNDGFMRQRRNLMIISLLLLLSLLSELSVQKISAFGNELLVGKPQVVTFSLWVAGFYWLVRYYQYSRSKFGAIRAAVFYRVNELSLPVALRVLLKAHPEFSVRRPDIQMDPTVKCVDHTLMGQQTGYQDLKLKLRKSATAGLGAVHELGEYPVRIEGSELRMLRARAWLHLIMHTTLFTDLVMPYILFYIPVVYGTYRVMSSD